MSTAPQQKVNRGGWVPASVRFLLLLLSGCGLVGLILSGCGFGEVCSDADPARRCASGYVCQHNACVPVDAGLFDAGNLELMDVGDLQPAEAGADAEQDGSAPDLRPAIDASNELGPAPDLPSDQGPATEEPGPPVACPDEDGDRYCTDPTGTCDPVPADCRGAPDWDCRDDDVAIHPGAPERCDRVDQDCDGATDEDFPRLGQECSAGEGDCRQTAAWECDVTGSAERCPAVADDPGLEVCDGRDNDCDGLTDEELGQLTCGQGVCRRTTDACVGGIPRECVPGDREVEVEPAGDCDGRDNDCDGAVDEGCPCPPPDRRECYSGQQSTRDVGECRSGQQDCVDHRWPVECEGEVLPSPESCDGRDNDCDGQTDEGLDPPLASRQAGVCQGSRQVCGGRTGWQEPDYGQLQGYEASETRCDGLDNDCDGQTDQADPEVVPPWASLRQGVCAGTRTICVPARGGWVDPDWAELEIGYQNPDRTCNGQDNDCDGIAEAFDAPCYNGPLGTEGRGVCHGGTQHCSAGTWGPCVGEVTPVPERTCNGQDDDCDGVAESFDEPCYSGAEGTRDVGECRGGVRHCANGTWGACQGEVVPAQERCNGRDDDCDGWTDDTYRNNQQLDRGMAFIPAANPFCIDLYEASAAGATVVDPGSRVGAAYSVPGVLPWTDLDRAVASVACQAAGKKLCLADQWRRACTGEPATTYPYGNEYQAAACNTFDRDPGDPHLLTTPTVTCVSRELVYDLSGNVEEWVSDVPDANGRVAGGTYWGGAAQTACTNIRPLPQANHAATLGFRCCKDQGAP